MDLNLISDYLNNSFAGCSIESTETVEEFSKRINTSNPDIVLSDYKLGNYTALDALQIALESHAHTPFIIVTGAISEETAAQCLREGIWDYVLKDKLYKLEPAITHALQLQQKLSKAHEASLKMLESERKFQTIMEKSPFAMWISDSIGTVRMANHTLLQTLHLREDQVVGKYNVLHDENISEQGLLNKVESVFTNHSTIRFTMYWKASEIAHTDFSEGRDMWIDASLFPILDSEGKLKHVVCQWLDITKRKQIEEQQQQQIQEMEVFHNAAVDRELLINEYRREINELRAKLNLKPKYRVVD